MGVFPGLSLRQPPSNLRAEQAVLGALLHNNKVIDQLAGLEPHHFADPVNGRVFAECRRLIDANHLASAVTLRITLENSGVLQDAGGVSYLVTLISGMVSLHVAEYARVVIDAWLRRQLIDVGEQIVNNAFGLDPELDGEKSVRDSIDKMLVLAQSIRGGRGRSFAQAVGDVLDEAEAARQGRGVKRLVTGVDTLDDIWGGLWPGLDVVAARSGHGKTVLGMQIAESVCEQIEEGECVQVFSLEMPIRDLVLRMYQSRTGVSADAIRMGRIEETADRLVRASRDMARLPLNIVDTPAMTLTDIAIRAKSDKRRLNTRLIVIDHLHRIAAPAHMSKTIRLEQVRYISAGLKDLSGEMGIPIIVLAQLSADVERRPDHRPRISDIEYLPERDADNIALFWRPGLYVTDAPREEDFKSVELFEKAKGIHYAKINKWKGKAEAIMGKRRFGPTAVTPLAFDENTLRFANVEEQ